MTELKSSLQLLLRAADVIRAAIDTYTTAVTGPETLVGEPRSWGSSRRILAVISHRDEFDRHEEGRYVFIWRTACPVTRELVPFSSNYPALH